MSLKQGLFRPLSSVDGDTEALCSGEQWATESDHLGIRLLVAFPAPVPTASHLCLSQPLNKVHWVPRKRAQNTIRKAIFLVYS